MLKSKRFLFMSIFSFLVSMVCFILTFCGKISIRSNLILGSTSNLIIGYIFKVSCIVSCVFFVVFLILFFVSDRIKQTKTTFWVSIIAFIMVVSSTVLISYFRTDYSVLESIDILTEKKRSVETFDDEFKKYLLNNEYFEYDEKYVLIESLKIPGSTFNYVECLPWDYSDLNIEYHLECFESTNNSLINKFRDEIYLRNLVSENKETHNDDSYVLYENTVDNDMGNDAYLNIIVEKNNIVYSVEIYTTKEVIDDLGKSKIIDDVLQNYNRLKTGR